MTEIPEDVCREKLAQVMLRNSVATGHGDTFDDLLSELEFHLADRASRPAAVPRVKPLEWEEARFGDKWQRFQAESIFGYYEALEFSDGGFGFSCPPAIDDNHLTTKPADSIENSKAAAQADYEKRVLSALAAAPAAAQAQEPGSLPDREMYWLIERDVSPPQYVSTNSAGWHSDVWQARRFKTEREAHDYWRMMTAADRVQFTLVEHMFINKLPTAPQASTTDAEPDWRDDPAADERWSAGLDYAMTQLCGWTGADPKKVVWDAATETLEGDVWSVIGNIMRTAYGEDFPHAAPQAKAGTEELVGAVEAHLAAFDAPVELDTWDTETGEYEEGAERCSSDWAHDAWHDEVNGTRDALRAALAKHGGRS